MQDPQPTKTANLALTFVKVVHTFVWVVFAGCILAIPITSWLGKHTLAAWLSVVVAIEVVVLVLNQMSCPLTAVAARYTENRRDNFDIYLPEWLAKHNKVIFGTLYLAGVLFAIIRWAIA